MVQSPEHTILKKRNLEHLLNFKSIDDFGASPPNEYICAVRVCHSWLQNLFGYEFISHSHQFESEYITLSDFELNRHHFQNAWHVLENWLFRKP